MVRVDGFEPPATRSQGECASWLRYTRTNFDRILPCAHSSRERRAGFYCIQRLVAAPGIEPDSLVLQTSAFT
jgi:hypothetical protein